MSILCLPSRFILFLLIVAVPLCGSNGVDCPRNLPHTTTMKRFGEFCYQFVSEERFWFQARDFCLQFGGRLVKIDNAVTNAFVVNTLNALWWRNDGVWIGLHDTSREMQFQWTGYSSYENEPLGNWNNWARGHPGAFFHNFRDCIRMVREGGLWKWHETPCSAMKWHYRFICQYKALVPVHTEPQTSALRQHSLVSNDSSKITTPTTTSATTTTILQTTQPESKIIVLHDNVEYPAEPVPDTQEMNQTTFTPKVTTEVDLWTLSGLFVRAYKINDDSPEVGEMRSADDTSAVGIDGSAGRLSMIAVFCLAAVCFVMVTVFLLQRRRKKQKMADNGFSNDAIESCKAASDQNPSPPSSSTVSNVYVISNDTKDKLSRSSRLPNDVTQYPEDVDRMLYDSPAKTADHSILNAEDREASVEDCGMMGYDMPKPTHLYSEIPESDAQPGAAEGHLYESLDDIIKKLIL